MAAGRSEAARPLLDTRWTELFLVGDGRLRPEPAAGGTCGFDVRHGRARWQWPIADDVELSGPMALRLYMEAQDADDVSLCIGVPKLRNGWVVPFEGWGYDLVTSGWLKASQRALDTALSTPWEPVHLDTRSELLGPGQIVAMDIPLAPSVTLFAANEALVVEAGRWWYPRGPTERSVPGAVRAERAVGSCCIEAVVTTHGSWCRVSRRALRARERGVERHLGNSVQLRVPPLGVGNTMSLHVRLLGAPSVTLDDVTLMITTRKAVALLAYLAVTGVAHTRDALAALFWPEADTEHARGALRYTLAQLRAELGGAWLASSRSAIGLATRADLQVDVRAVEALYARVAEHGHPLREPCPVCAPLLRNAVAQQRGALLAGFSLPDSPAFDDWLLFESERLQRAQAYAFAALIGVYRAAGTPAEATMYAQRWLALDSLDEDANRVLLELLIDSGQRSAAQRHYAAYATLLRTELGVEPDAAATALIAQLSISASMPAATAAPARHAAAGAARLPTRELPRAAGPLVGRAHEVAALGRLLGDPSCRLLTLFGPGGSGKTRLATAVADIQRHAYADGVAWVALAGIESPGAVAALAASAVGCPLAAGDDAEQRLLDFLRARHLLLILDNLEHFVPHSGDDSAGVVEFVERILQTTPHVQVLVTSRVRLQLYDEQLYPVQGLAFPEGDAAADAHTYAAVQLFVTRARRQHPGFTLDAATAPPVIRITRMLAGQPLALELAADWIGSLHPNDIAHQLERTIDLLATDARNVPARHRSMRASYTLSWQRLRASDQALHQALSVFHGGFSLEAAAQIAGATPQSLRTLLDHSLLALSTRTSSTRYDVHELLRQYAAEQLLQSPAAQAAVLSRHATYYLAIAEAAHSAQEQSDAVRLAQVEADYDNLRAAFQWMLDSNDAEGCLRLCKALHGYWHSRGHVSEGRHWLRAALALPCVEVYAPRADALAAASGFAFMQGDWTEAVTVLDAALTISRALGDTGHITGLLREQGWLALMRGAYAEATTVLEESIALYRNLRDQHGIASGLSYLGQAAYEQHAFAQAIPLLTESLAISRALDDHIGVAWSLNKLGLVALYQRMLPEAARLLEESLATFIALKHTGGVAWGRGSLGWVRMGDGAYVCAAELFADSLVYYDERGDKRNIAFGLERLASLAGLQGQATRAARLFSAAMTLRQQRMVPLPPVDQTYYAPYLAMVREKLGTERFTVVWAEGAVLSTRQAIDYALGQEQRSER